jgi:hypothetical protein
MRWCIVYDQPKTLDNEHIILGYLNGRRQIAQPL